MRDSGPCRVNQIFEKPLALILGKPMIQWVYEHCKEVELFEEVYVATDSEKSRPRPKVSVPKS